MAGDDRPDDRNTDEGEPVDPTANGLADATAESGDETWQSLDEDASEDVAEELFEEEETTEMSATDAPDEAVVPKRTFCERCEWFTAPPEVRCTHEGTEIIRLEDSDHFRVSNCPIVEERKDLAEDILVGED